MIEQRLRQEDLPWVSSGRWRMNVRSSVAMWLPSGRRRPDDDLAVAQLRQLEVLAETAPQRRHQIREPLFSSIRQRCALRVQHLAPQWQDRLARAIAALLGRPARRITLDDEQLAARSLRSCVLSFPGGSIGRGRALARDLGLRGAAASRARAARMICPTMASATLLL